MTLEDFVDRLIQEKGGNRAELLEQVEDHMNAAILDELPESQYDAFGAAMDAGTEQTFLREHINNFDEFMAGALMAFRNDYLKS